MKKNPGLEKSPSGGPRMSGQHPCSPSYCASLTSPLEPRAASQSASTALFWSGPYSGILPVRGYEHSNLGPSYHWMSWTGTILYSSPDLLVSSQQSVSSRCKGSLRLRWPPTWHQAVNNMKVVNLPYKAYGLLWNSFPMNAFHLDSILVTLEYLC